MKRTLAFALFISLLACLVACGDTAPTPVSYSGTQILLSDDGITVDGAAVSQDTGAPVYAAKDIIFYEDGKDFTYGEGDRNDGHTQEEADAHIVLHITAPGQYVLSGNLSKGQVAVDLGKDAKDDPTAVVTLVLNGADITCEVAPAVIFYNVYECGNPDAPSATVDTSAAGANVVLGEGAVNNISGSYVAKIYKPESVVLSEDGKKVEDAKKLHKYDGAFYSKTSMNISGNGILNIDAKNEGLDSEMHLTINGGTININSGNDGINTNEDNVSVTTINDGNLNILVNGATGEGDGIDSNGWLVLNGGTVISQACGFSGDAGIDSDMGIHINGGTVFATGNMLDHISESKQNFAVFQFSESQKVDKFAEEYRTYTLKNSNGDAVISGAPTNAFSYLIVSTPSLTAGEYTFWQGADQLAGTASAAGSGFGGFSGNFDWNKGEAPEDFTFPEGMEPGDFPEGAERPEGMEPGDFPEGAERPEGMEPGKFPEGAERPEGQEGNRPDSNRNQGGLGGFGGFGGIGGQITGESSHLFQIEDGANYFVGITIVTAVPIA